MISVVVPTYQEYKNIPILLYLLHQLTHDLEIIVVDDNSPDGTADLVDSISAHLTRQSPWFAVKVARRKAKLGLGTAYIEGLRHCSGKFVIIMDADLSHLPYFINNFVQKQKQTGADIVTGTRYGDGGGVNGWPMTRKLISRCANFLANQIFWTQFSDLTGSFRMYKREVIESLLGQVTSKGYAFQMEILIRAHSKGFKIEEVPIVFVDRIYGESKLSGSEVVKFLQCIWTLLWQIS